MRAIHGTVVFLALPLLGACGVETVTATATAAKIKAEEVKAGQQQMERAEEKLNALSQQSMERLENLDGLESADTP